MHGYDIDDVNEFIAYHIANGGVSRYKKFDYFFNNILKRNDKNLIDQALLNFSNNVLDGLMNCELNLSLCELKNIYNKSRWAVASGGDESELRHVFNKRDITDLFELGIFGSPKSKEEIMRSIVNRSELEQPALFIGDSFYDYKAAKDFDLDFLFIEEWSEYNNWKKHIGDDKFFYMQSLEDLL